MDAMIHTMLVARCTQCTGRLAGVMTALISLIAQRWLVNDFKHRQRHCLKQITQNHRRAQEAIIQTTKLKVANCVFSASLQVSRDHVICLSKSAIIEFVTFPQLREASLRQWRFIVRLVRPFVKIEGKGRRSLSNKRPRLTYDVVCASS